MKKTRRRKPVGYRNYYVTDKSQNRSVTIALTAELVQMIENECRQRNVNRAAFIRNALTEYFKVMSSHATA